MKESGLEFNEELHQYSVNDRKLLSVTQLLGLVQEGFNADEILDKMFKGDEIYLGKKKELIGMTKDEVKQLWSLNNTAKSRYGTYIHNEAEKVALEYKYSDSMVSSTSDRPEIKQVVKFFNKEGYKVIEAEKQVYSEKFGIAGTMDLLLEKDGKYYIGDWKTNLGKDLSDYNGDKWTKNLKYPLDNIPDLHYWIYALQFSIYRYIMENEFRYFENKLVNSIFDPEDPDLEMRPLEFGGQFMIHLQESQMNCPYDMKQITYKKINTPYLKDEVERLLDWYKEED